MNKHNVPPIGPNPSSDITVEERSARENLAAFYRICHMFGWTELIYNHITARVPGPERHFLINQFGLMYNEITASNLAKIDVDGRVADGTSVPVNTPGFTIHSAIHIAPQHAHYIAHPHPTEGLTVATSHHRLPPPNSHTDPLHA